MKESGLKFGKVFDLIDLMAPLVKQNRPLVPRFVLHIMGADSSGASRFLFKMFHVKHLEERPHASIANRSTGGIQPVCRRRLRAYRLISHSGRPHEENPE